MRSQLLPPLYAGGASPHNDGVAAWYEELFDERYLDFYQLAVEPAAAEAAFVDHALGLDRGARLLDLGCGFGRHVVALALRGHRVMGLDLSAVLLERAAELAARAGVEVDWTRRDMRQLGGLGPFDGCVCLYTAFGYFDDEDNEAVLRAVHAALRPGGHLLLDLSNPLALMRGWPAVRWREHPRGVTRERCDYHPVSGRLRAERTLFCCGGEPRRELPPSSVRMYAPSEVVRLLRDAGFEIEQLHGGLDGEPFAWDRSVKQVWVGRRP